MGIIIVLLVMLLMSAIGAALTLATATDMAIAGHFQRAQEAHYAAAGALEAAVGESRGIPDWNGVLDGSVRSATVDGPPAGVRMVAGQPVDLAQLKALLECQQLAPCTDADIRTVTADRPWGANNPRWRLFDYGSWAIVGSAPSAFYTVVLVGDDPMEQDGDPVRDGAEGTPGAGRVRVRAEAFGPSGAHAAVEALLERNARNPAEIRVMTWRFTAAGAS